MERRIFVFDSGVEIWNMTPSKSETVWSIDTGGALSDAMLGRPFDNDGVPGTHPEKRSVKIDCIKTFW